MVVVLVNLCICWVPHVTPYHNSWDSFQIHRSLKIGFCILINKCLPSYEWRLSWVCLHIVLQFIRVFWETLCGSFCTGNFCMLHLCQQMESGRERERESRDDLQLYTDWSGSIGTVTSEYGAEFTDERRPEWLKNDWIIACCKQDKNAGMP
jgi:hypothetical protein